MRRTMMVFAGLLAAGCGTTVLAPGERGMRICASDADCAGGSCQQGFCRETPGVDGGLPEDGGNAIDAGYTLDAGRAGCAADAHCAATQFCEFPVGACGIADVLGVCRDRPGACTREYAPVCGCDGRTFSNACEAAAAGMNVRRAGPCDPGRCSPDAPCPPSQWCDFEPNLCGQGSGTGVCRDRPRACTQEYAPVCGCDGQTYGNRCSAYAAGVDIAALGPCAPAPCSLAEPCLAGFVCHYEPASCGAGIARGICREIPRTCPLIPCIEVCGCDGQTYCGTCEAWTAGTDVAHLGACRPSTVSCGPARPCPATQFCDYPEGTCGGIGECRDRPGACITLYDPVCGCDGRTYSNGCVANAAGVDVKFQGPCPEPRRCDAQTPCGTAEWCDFEPNSCGAAGVQGVCRLRPGACIDLYRPVCGCDGQTYSNACVANVTGVDIRHEGPCNAAQLCMLGVPCPEGYVCDYAQNTCGVAGETGVCRKKPENCPIMPPCPMLCGCDGRVYCSECEAWAAGTDLGPNDACQPATTCGPDRPCAEGEFCDFPPGTCGGAGVCRLRPEACPDLWRPVCGCDGQTYANSCDANFAGVDVAREGPCEKPCGGFLGLVCPDGQYCDFEPNSCGSGDQMGVCRERPQDCPLTFACIPVCGCDGRTYCSPCEAARAGTDIAREGACEATGQECSTERLCPAGYTCHWEPSTCGRDGTAGKCVPRPTACPLMIICSPVCGCDGRTYCSPCEAWAAGTDVASAGYCDAAGQRCGGALTVVCPEAYFCDYPDDACGAGELGYCRPRPRACTTEYAPVCGCDGRTYSNACVAHAAGIDVKGSVDCR